MMKKKNTNLLDADISARYKREKEEINQPNETVGHDKAIGIIFSVALALVILSGVLYPLFTH